MTPLPERPDTMDTAPSTAPIGVVIPYFQREPGILRKCVESVLAQEGVGTIHVVVVDDASPLPAATELDGLDPRGHNLDVVRQPNTGPGGARNHGIDRLPASTRYIAFIDSDDCWEPAFLAHAMAALEAGYDVFFANSRRHGFAEARFDWHAASQRQLVAAQHPLIDAALDLHAFDGSFFDYALVRSNIISTSALVYRRACAPALRFSSRLFNGQDRLFKLHLARATTRIAFCPRILVSEGTGINIYDSAKWGSAKSLRLLANYIRLAKTILDEIELSAAQREEVLAQLDDSRYSMTASVLHLLKSGQNPDWPLLFRTAREDPALVLGLIPNLARILRRRRAAPQRSP